MSVPEVAGIQNCKLHVCIHYYVYLHISLLFPKSASGLGDATRANRICPLWGTYSPL